MKKTISKALALALVFMLAVSTVAFAAAEGTYEDGTAASTTIATITGVAPGDEVTVLAVTKGVKLEDVEEDDIKYINQDTADSDGKATFELAVNAADVDVYSGYSSMADDAVALKLVFSAAETPVTTYKVTFNGKDGAMIKEVTVEENGTVADADFPTAPEVEGFTFKGWFVGAEEFKSTTIITADLSVDAKYEEIPAVTIVYGDIDGNGAVELRDAIMTLQLATGELVGTEAQRTAGDVDANGAVELRDAINVLKKSTGELAKFPVEQ